MTCHIRSVRMSEECSDTVVGLDMLVSLSIGLQCSLKRFVTAFALNHSSKVFIVLTTVNSLKHVWVCARVSWPTAKDRGNGLWQA